MGDWPTGQILANRWPVPCAAEIRGYSDFDGLARLARDDSDAATLYLCEEPGRQDFLRFEAFCEPQNASMLERLNGGAVI